MFEGKNINQKMTLRNQLKNVKIQNAETVQSYFARVSQIKEKLEAIDEEVEMQRLWWLPWMASLGHGMLSFKESVQERSWYLLAESEKNEDKINLES